MDDFKNYKALVEESIEEFLDERYKLLAPSVPSGGLIVSFIMKVMQGSYSVFFKLNYREYDLVAIHY